MRLEKVRLYLLPGLFSLILIFTSYSINKNHEGIDKVIRADASGYYTWLPAVVIYQDNSFTFCDTAFNRSPHFPKGSFRGIIVPVTKSDSSKTSMNKYPPGAAICALPFFMVAHTYGLFINQTIGYEVHYQLAWWFAAVFFICLGIFALFKLGRLLNLPDLMLGLLIAGLVFGTNLYHYSTFDAGYSHAFTFGLSALAAMWLFMFQQSSKKTHLFLAIVVFGLIVVVRSFNILLVPVIFLVTNQKGISWWYGHKKIVAFGLALLGLIISIVFIGNYFQTGEFLIYTYGEERFNFDEPHFLKFFIGFEIGTFVYSPLIALGLVFALWISIYHRKRVLLTLITLFSYFTIGYVLSCWWHWKFGCTLGNRPMIDWLIPLCLTLLFVLPRTFSWKKYIPLSFVVLSGIYYSQVLHYQYRNHILNWCEMDKEKFMDVFMITDLSYAFYTIEGWDFSKTVIKSVDTLYHHPNEKVFDFNLSPYDNLEITQLDSLFTSDTILSRLRFTAEARFDEKRDDQKILIYMNKGDEFHALQRKYLKRKLRKSKVWGPVLIDFFIPHTPKKLSSLLLVAPGSSKITLRNITIEWLTYENGE